VVSLGGLHMHAHPYSRLASYMWHTNTNESTGKTAVTSGGRPSRLTFEFQHMCMARSQPVDSNTSRESQVSNSLPREL
jgi:hypothetical protein